MRRPSCGGRGLTGETPSEVQGPTDPAAQPTTEGVPALDQRGRDLRRDRPPAVALAAHRRGVCRRSLPAARSPQPGSGRGAGHRAGADRSARFDTPVELRPGVLRNCPPAEAAQHFADVRRLSPSLPVQAGGQGARPCARARCTPYPVTGTTRPPSAATPSDFPNDNSNALPGCRRARAPTTSGSSLDYRRARSRVTWRRPAARSGSVAASRRSSAPGPAGFWVIPWRRVTRRRT